MQRFLFVRVFEHLERVRIVELFDRDLGVFVLKQ